MKRLKLHIKKLSRLGASLPQPSDKKKGSYFGSLNF